MEHYVRSDAAGHSAPVTPASRERLHRRLARWVSGLVADRKPSRKRPSNLIRNHDGTGTVISSNHGGGGGGA